MDAALLDLLSDFATKHATIILGLFVVSEILGNMSSLKESSIFQIIVNIIRGLKDAIIKTSVTKVDPPPPPK